MKHKYTKAELDYFTKPIPKVGVDYDWAWWALFCVMVIMEVIFVLKVLGKI